VSSILTGGSTIPAGSHHLLTAILTAIPFRQVYAHLMPDVHYEIASYAAKALEG